MAPKRPQFARDSVPHAGAKDQLKAREEWMRTPGPKFAQRKRTRYDERPSRSPRTFERKSAEEDTTRSSASTLTVDASEPVDKTVKPLQNRKQVEELLGDMFQLSPKGVSTKQLPTDFTSPPLMEGLHSSLMDILGPNAQPTPIQALSLKHLLSTPTASSEWKQYLLASETGSGKSIAYLLPLLQALKQGELDGTATQSSKRHLTSPRALVLAPTHELTRQLSVFAKSLIHNIKLRILCASRSNVPTSSKRHITASKMASELEVDSPQEGGGEFVVSSQGSSAKPVDLLVGTPSKVLDMVRGRGWDHERREIHIEDTFGTDEQGRKLRPKKFTVGPPEISLENVEWVIVDEADVLFGILFLTYYNFSAHICWRVQILTSRNRLVCFWPILLRLEDNQSHFTPKWFSHLLLTRVLLLQTLRSPTTPSTSSLPLLLSLPPLLHTWTRTTLPLRDSHRPTCTNSHLVYEQNTNPGQVVVARRMSRTGFVKSGGKTRSLQANRLLRRASSTIPPSRKVRY